MKVLPGMQEQLQATVQHCFRNQKPCELKEEFTRFSVGLLFVPKLHLVCLERYVVPVACLIRLESLDRKEESVANSLADVSN